VDEPLAESWADIQLVEDRIRVLLRVIWQAGYAEGKAARRGLSPEQLEVILCAKKEKEGCEPLS
jgi:hypothetical protein